MLTLVWTINRNMVKEIPSPIDLRRMEDAKEWESTAMDRPYRLEFFEQFYLELKKLNKGNLNILELGSGPGFLAQYVLEKMPNTQMTLLDFSSAMHELAYERIGNNVNRVKFINKDFKSSNWHNELDIFDAVITNQAVHELRHKSYAEEFHKQVKKLLVKNGIYLVCDHYVEEGSSKNSELFMSLAESRVSLENADFNVRQVFVHSGRYLYLAT